MHVDDPEALTALPDSTQQTLRLCTGLTRLPSTVRLDWMIWTWHLPISILGEVAVTTGNCAAMLVICHPVKRQGTDINPLNEHLCFEESVTIQVSVRNEESWE
jgi:hypothetical protein